MSVLVGVLNLTYNKRKPMNLNGPNDHFPQQPQNKIYTAHKPRVLLQLDRGRAELIVGQVLRSVYDRMSFRLYLYLKWKCWLRGALRVPAVL